LARLTSFHTQFGRIDASVKMVEIFWERPLTIDISASSGGVKVAPETR
jgi:hypothetical protein